MTDGFICDVIANNMDGTWTVRPRIVEYDGMNHRIIKVTAVGGVYPSTGDVVLVVTARNNLDDKKVNRFYKASESNGRIVAIANTLFFYTFKGDFKYTGTVIFDGNLSVQEDLVVNGNLMVAGNASMTGNITGGGNLTITGEASVGSLIIGGSPYLLHTHANNAPTPGPTGPVI